MRRNYLNEWPLNNHRMTKEQIMRMIIYYILYRTFRPRWKKIVQLLHFLAKFGMVLSVETNEWIDENSRHCEERPRSSPLLSTPTRRNSPRRRHVLQSRIWSPTVRNSGPWGLPWRLCIFVHWRRCTWPMEDPAMQSLEIILQWICSFCNEIFSVLFIDKRFFYRWFFYR